MARAGGAAYNSGSSWELYLYRVLQMWQVYNTIYILYHTSWELYLYRTGIQYNIYIIPYILGTVSV